VLTLYHHPFSTFARRVRISRRAWRIVLLGGALPRARRAPGSRRRYDANRSRTTPCKTFAGAMPKMAAGGEIDVLDPGGFGTVTITKAITIDATGALGGVFAAGTNGIVINAGATDRVVLRGLSVNGASTGSNTE
jgi:hypothetical protein